LMSFAGTQRPEAFRVVTFNKNVAAANEGS
jgi:hypothetical protein